MRAKGFRSAVIAAALSVVLCVGMPAGTTGSILADKYDGDAVFASQIAFTSTLCSILTIPLLTLVMESFPF